MNPHGKRIIKKIIIFCIALYTLIFVFQETVGVDSCPNHIPRCTRV